VAGGRRPAERSQHGNFGRRFFSLSFFSLSRTRCFSVMDIVYEYESLWHDSLWGNLAGGRVWLGLIGL
jgi:hypothetical protein